MSGNKKQPLVPRLRFPEFKNTAEWQSPTLGEVSEPVEERVGERKLTPVSISAGIGFVPQAEKFGRDISGSQYKLYTVVRDGDFVYNKGNSLKFPQGCVYDLQGWGEVAAPNVFICFRLKNGYENGFYRQCFERNVHGIQLRKHITSGARSNGLLNISKEAFYGVAIPVPSHAEQQKIADCLSSLDDLIAAETYKLDTLKTHKKGLMQQLFPREGETVPRLRFPEFRDAREWKESNLGELTSIVRGGSPRPIDDFLTSAADGLNWLKIGDVDRDAKYIISTEEKVRAEALSKTRVIQPGDFILSNSMSFGRPYISTIQTCIHDGWIAVTKIPASLNSDFLYYALLSERSQKYFFDQAAGSGVQNLNKDIIKTLVLGFPEVKEQQCIADCLSFLDDFINAQTQKIEALKTQKKGLMQQLFPTLDEVDA